MIKMNRISNVPLMKVHQVDSKKLYNIINNEMSFGGMDFQVHKIIKCDKNKALTEQTCYNILNDHDISHTVPLLGLKCVRYHQNHSSLGKEPLKSLIESCGVINRDIVQCYYALDIDYNMRLVKVVI